MAAMGDKPLVSYSCQERGTVRQNREKEDMKASGKLQRLDLATKARRALNAYMRADLGCHPAPGGWTGHGEAGGE